VSGARTVSFIIPVVIAVATDRRPTAEHHLGDRMAVCRARPPGDRVGRASDEQVRPAPVNPRHGRGSTMSAKEKTVSFRIDEETVDELRSIDDDREQSLSAVFRDYVDAFVDQDGQVAVVPAARRRVPATRPTPAAPTRSPSRSPPGSCWSTSGSNWSASTSANSSPRTRRTPAGPRRSSAR